MGQEKDLMRRLISDTAKMDGLYYLWGKSTGVSENMLTLMYALNDGKVHTQKQICEQFSIPKTTINTIKQLIKFTFYHNCNNFFKPIAKMLGATEEMMGYSVGTAPIIGYHYGAENKEELKSLLNKSLKLLGIVAIIMTSLAEILAIIVSGICILKNGKKYEYI